MDYDARGIDLIGVAAVHIEIRDFSAHQFHSSWKHALAHHDRERNPKVRKVEFPDDTRAENADPSGTFESNSVRTETKPFE